MLRSSFFFASAVAAGFLGLTSVGCGDDSAATTGAGGGGGAGTGTGAGAGDVVLKAPPERPAGAPDAAGDGAIMGVSALYLGDVDRSGVKSPKAWEGFGFDLDGVATVDVACDKPDDDSCQGGRDGKITSVDLEGRNCSPVQSAANAAALEDGEGGVDNSFGRNILAFLGSVLENPSALATEAIQEGSFTLALDMTNLGTAANENNVATNLYAAVGGEDDVWETVPDILIQFPNAFVVDNTWVSGEPQTITLNLSIADVQLGLSINSAVIAVDLDAARTSGSNGVIAGVLDTQEFVDELGKVAAEVAGGATEGLCPGDPLFESIVQNIRNASDIMNNGTQAPGQTCNGISIALGFDATTIVLGEEAEPSEPGEPSSCPGG